MLIVEPFHAVLVFGLVFDSRFNQSDHTVVNFSISQSENSIMIMDTSVEKEMVNKCETCNASFSSKKYMQKHIDRIHKGKKPYMCNICNLSYKSKRTLIGHNASVHEGKKPFKCDICDYSCSQKGTMKRHIASVHEGKNIQM